MLSIAAVSMFLAPGIIGHVQAPLPGMFITGYVTDALSGLPIVGASVSCGSPYPATATTIAPNGFYSLGPLYAYGTFTVTVTKTDYVTQSKLAEVAYHVNGRADFAMTPSWGWYGWAKDVNGNPVDGATVKFYAMYATTILTTATNGYFWYHNRNGGYVGTIEATKADYWLSFYTPAWSPTLTTLKRGDFMMQPNIIAKTTVAAIFCSLDYSHSTATLKIAQGTGGTHSVTCNIAGSGGTKSESWSLTIDRVASNVPSLVIKKESVITGEYNMGTGKVVGSWVKEFWNVYDWEYTMHDYWDQDDIDVKTIDPNKGGIEKNVPGNMALNLDPVRILKDATESVTFQLGLQLSLTVFKIVSLQYTSIATFTDTVTTSLSISFWNTDDSPHSYKWYLEGTNNYDGGAILHLWELEDDVKGGGKKH